MTKLKKAVNGFGARLPFPHAVVDGFFDKDFARCVELEILGLEEALWHRYDNALELKQTMNDWNSLPTCTYRALSAMLAPEVTSVLSAAAGVSLVPDFGLHGGGSTFTEQAVT